jgi:RNA polymerase sigma-32 factor
MARLDDGWMDRAEISYIRHCMKTPLLSRERERMLAASWRDRHDQQSLQELILAYGRLVIGAAARLRGYGLPAGDLIQEGNIGLMEAATRFDPDRQVRFSTYAAWWIRASMQDYILRNWSIVRTGTTAAQKSLFFNLRRLRARIADPSRVTMSLGEIERIAAALGVAPREVSAMEQRLAGGDSSLSATLGEDSEESWLDRLADGRPNPEEAVTSAHDEERRRHWLKLALDRLPARERRIVEARRLAENGLTLEDLGREFGVSKERVRQLEQRALGRLRKEILAAAGIPAPCYSGRRALRAAVSVPSSR